MLYQKIFFMLKRVFFLVSVLILLTIPTTSFSIKNGPYSSEYNSWIGAHKTYSISSNGDINATIYTSEIGTNTFLWLNKIPNLALKYQMFSLTNNSLSFHFIASLAHTNLGSTNHFIDLNTFKLSKNELDQEHNLSYFIKVIDSFTFYNKYHFSIGIGDHISSGKNSESKYLIHRFFPLIAFEITITDMLFVKSTTMWPIIYAAEYITTKADEEVYDILDTYYEAALVLTYINLTIETGVQYLPINFGFNKEINIRNSFLGILKNPPNTSHSNLFFKITLNL